MNIFFDEYKNKTDSSFNLLNYYHKKSCLIRIFSNEHMSIQIKKKKYCNSNNIPYIQKKYTKEIIRQEIRRLKKLDCKTKTIIYYFRFYNILFISIQCCIYAYVLVRFIHCICIFRKHIHFHLQKQDSLRYNQL